MYAAVVRSVRVKRFRTYADGKCSEDFHVSIAEGKYCDMQLVSQQRVKPHDSNVKLVIINSLTKVVQRASSSCSDIQPNLLRMDICDKVLNSNHWKPCNNCWRHMKRILQHCPFKLILIHFLVHAVVGWDHKYHLECNRSRDLSDPALILRYMRTSKWAR